MNVTSEALTTIDTLFDRAVKDTVHGVVTGAPAIVSTKEDRTQEYHQRFQTTQTYSRRTARSVQRGTSSTHTHLLQEKDHHLVTLSMVSCDFRLVSMFEFPDSGDTKEFFANSAMGRSSSDNQERGGEGATGLLDHLCEFVNLTCGSVTRGIRDQHPYLGMSTPYILSSKCKHHAGMMRPAHVRSMDFDVEQRLRFNLTYALCVSDGFHLNLRLPPENIPEASGELELF